MLITGYLEICHPTNFYCLSTYIASHVQLSMTCYTSGIMDTLKSKCGLPQGVLQGGKDL